MDNHQFSTIYCAGCGYSVQVPVRCHRRFCAVCGRSAAARARARMQWIINTFPKTKSQRWRLLTLTVQSSADLQEQIERLIKGFRRLRNRKDWKRDVIGGLYVMEVTHSEKGWHAHIHIVMMSVYMPQHYLSRIWKSITGSPIVDIRQCKNNGLATYLTQYLTKCDVPTEHRSELETVMHDRRLWSPFGFCHDLNMQYVPQKPKCPCCGDDAWMSQRQVDRLWVKHDQYARGSP